MTRDQRQTSHEHQNGDEVINLLGQAAERLRLSRAEAAEFTERLVSSNSDRLIECESPLGAVYVGVGVNGARLLGRAASSEEFTRRYRERFGRLLSAGTDDEYRRTVSRLNAMLSGSKREVAMDFSGMTGFQQRVLSVVRDIPRGEVRPYSWVAHQAGSPGASRAVGTVMARNPLPLLIPCHRVVKNDGTTGRYVFGTETKTELLCGEGVPVNDLAGSLYLATPTTGIFCFATCPSARRIKPVNRRWFSSVGTAMGAGFRPCKVCRPDPAASMNAVL